MEAPLEDAPCAPTRVGVGAGAGVIGAAALVGPHAVTVSVLVETCTPSMLVCVTTSVKKTVVVVVSRSSVPRFLRRGVAGAASLCERGVFRSE